MFFSLKHSNLLMAHLKKCGLLNTLFETIFDVFNVIYRKCLFFESEICSSSFFVQYLKKCEIFDRYSIIYLIKHLSKYLVVNKIIIFRSESYFVFEWSLHTVYLSTNLQRYSTLYRIPIFNSDQWPPIKDAQYVRVIGQIFVKNLEYYTVLCLLYYVYTFVSVHLDTFSCPLRTNWAETQDNYWSLVKTVHTSTILKLWNSEKKRSIKKKNNPNCPGENSTLVFLLTVFFLL